MLLEKKIIGVRAIDAPDFINIAKPAGRHKRGLRTRPLEHRVDGDGRTVKKKPGRRKVRPRFFHARLDTFDHRTWGRKCFAEQKAVVSLVESGHVRERASDIGREAQSMGGMVRRAFDDFHELAPDSAVRVCGA